MCNKIFVNAGLNYILEIFYLNFKNVLLPSLTYCNGIAW